MSEATTTLLEAVKHRTDCKIRIVRCDEIKRFHIVVYLTFFTAPMTVCIQEVWLVPAKSRQQVIP